MFNKSFQGLEEICVLRIVYNRDGFELNAKVVDLMFWVLEQSWLTERSFAFATCLHLELLSLGQLTNDHLDD